MLSLNAERVGILEQACPNCKRGTLLVEPLLHHETMLFLVLHFCIGFIAHRHFASELLFLPLLLLQHATMLFLVLLFSALVLQLLLVQQYTMVFFSGVAFCICVARKGWASASLCSQLFRNRKSCFFFCIWFAHRHWSRALALYQKWTLATMKTIAHGKC